MTKTSDLFLKYEKDIYNQVFEQYSHVILVDGLNIFLNFFEKPGYKIEYDEFIIFLY